VPLRPVRVAHIVSHPVQYFAPLYRELARRPEIDLTVYFCSDRTAGAYLDPGFGRVVRWDIPLLDGYRWRVMPSARGAAIRDGFAWRPNLDIVREVVSGGYDVLWVHGYMQATTWLAAVAARARGMTVLLRDEQTLMHRRPLHRVALKEAPLRALFALSSGLYIGEHNRRYLRRYGMPDRRLFFVPYCVDNAFFQREARRLEPERDAIRRSFGVTDGAPAVLFVGKLVEKKQPLRLIEAFGRVRRTRPCWLLLAGDGPVKEQAETLVHREGIPGVRFLGFLNQSELPRAYSAADLFVLPSSHHETWGLVLNEAMNFGLPVVVSDRVGCAADLVEDGRNGLIVPHDSVDALARAIETLVSDADLRKWLGRGSRARIALYSVERAADGIVEACLARGTRTRSAEREELAA
jgi:glycosyltransferase involved in cell wall biosynthesis